MLSLLLLIRNLINSLLKKFDLRLTTLSNFKRLQSHTKGSFAFNFLNSIKSNKEKLFRTLKYMPFSKSQLMQDLFVLNQLNFKKGGFFVEFGAADGVNCSNTFLLEKTFKWKGILSEPAKIHHPKLFIHRKCKIEKKIIWKDSESELLFNQTFDSLASTIDKFSFLDINN